MIERIPAPLMDDKRCAIGDFTHTFHLSNKTNHDRERVLSETQRTRVRSIAEFF